jgi:hypothetical protein
MTLILPHQPECASVRFLVIGSSALVGGVSEPGASARRLMGQEERKRLG